MCRGNRVRVQLKTVCRISKLGWPATVDSGHFGISSVFTLLPSRREIARDWRVGKSYVDKCVTQRAIQQVPWRKLANTGRGCTGFRLDRSGEFLLHLGARTGTVNENQFLRVPCRIPLACRGDFFCPQLSQNPVRHSGMWAQKWSYVI
jgi:hypothetical protein